MRRWVNVRGGWGTHVFEWCDSLGHDDGQRQGLAERRDVPHGHDAGQLGVALEGCKGGYNITVDFEGIGGAEDISMLWTGFDSLVLCIEEFHTSS